MPAQSPQQTPQERTPAQQTAAQDAQATQTAQGRATGRGNAAAQDRTGTAAPAPGAPAPGGPGDARDPAYADYERRLWDRVGVIMGMETPQERKDAARAILAQAVRVQDSLAFGERVDVASLEDQPPLDTLAFPVHAFPPEWLAPARYLLEWANPRIDPALNPVQAMLSGIDTLGKEAADYGVSAYETQSNNLAAPEATCNGTSLAMVLQRLGYSREDLVNAIEAHLKRRLVAQQLRRDKVPDSEIPKRVAETDLSCVYLPPARWEARVRSYLQEENQRGSNYQRPRGASASSGEMDRWAKAFRDNAGVDDLALLLMSMLGIERTEVSVGGNPGKVLEAVHAVRGGARPTTERIESGKGWERTKPILRQTLEEGGAAMISIRHKGAGESGTHISAVQACTETGCIVDDPYGRIRPDYSARRAGDAYANRGQSRSTSGLRNAVDADREDWRTGAEVSPDETRGMNSHWTDTMIRESWSYVLLFRPATSVEPAAATP